jgi:PAS domain S-box-containing protein
MSHGSERVATSLVQPEALGLPVLARLLEASLDGIIVVDTERRYVYVNPSAAQILGYPADALIGQDFLMNFPVVEHDAMRSYFASSLGGRSGRHTSVIVRPTGEEREIEYADAKFRVGDQSLVGAIFRDVTDARRKEREAAMLARIAATLTVDQSMSATLDTLTAGVVLATNATAAAIALVDREQMRVRMFSICGLPNEFADAMEEAWPLATQAAAIRAVESQQIQVVQDARAWMQTSPRYERIHHLLPDMAWDTLVAFPLIYRGTAIGVLTIYYPSPGPPDAEIGLLSAIADHAAVAVENARLYAEAQGKAAIEERQRLARELHDSVSQALYGIGLGARTARALLDQQPEKAIAPMDYVLQLAEAGLTEMRALIFELRPETLELEGLVAALEKQFASLHARHRITVNAELCEEPDVPLPVKEAIYRVVQEALHNTIKHAHASTVNLRLERDALEIRFDISDDGVGFDSTASFPGHLGLRSMQERVSRLGGTILITSTPGAGTRIAGRIPIS